MIIDLKPELDIYMTYFKRIKYDSNTINLR